MAQAYALWIPQVWQTNNLCILFFFKKRELCYSPHSTEAWIVLFCWLYIDNTSSMVKVIIVFF